MNLAETLRARRPAHGFWCVTSDPGVLDTAASVGPDFICVDTQHGVDLGRLNASLFTTLASYGVPALVRVDSIEVGRIGRALDLGATGIVVPLVESADDAKRAVSACRYAPRGGRSYGMQTQRVDPFDEKPFVVIQVETAGAVEDIERIVAVEGVDALYIGPADMGLALGGEPAANLDQVFDGTHPNANQLAEAFEAVVQACKRTGVAAGLHCGSGALAVRAEKHGFNFSAVAADLGLIRAGLMRELETARAG